MKRAGGIIVIAALLAACGNSPNNTNGADSTGAKADTAIHTDTTNMMTDTTHKDSVVH